MYTDSVFFDKSLWISHISDTLPFLKTLFSFAANKQGSPQCHQIQRSAGMKIWNKNHLWDKLPQWAILNELSVSNANCHCWKPSLLRHTLNNTLISYVSWQNSGTTGRLGTRMEPALVTQDGSWHQNTLRKWLDKNNRIHTGVFK